MAMKPRSFSVCCCAAVLFSLPVGQSFRSQSVRNATAKSTILAVCGIRNPADDKASSSDDSMVRSLNVCKPETPANPWTDCSDRRVIVGNLKQVLDKEVPGAIAELGCNKGRTSVHIRRLLDAFKSSASGDRAQTREFHVYDSFEGLPHASERDKSTGESLAASEITRGLMLENIEGFRHYFSQLNLTVPSIHKGFFKDLPAAEYPDKIAFAYFDGDLYESILDSFHMTWDKLSPGGTVMIHDYGSPRFPGVQNATMEFLKDKDEKPEVCLPGTLARVVKKKPASQDFWR